MPAQTSVRVAGGWNAIKSGSAVRVAGTWQPLKAIFVRVSGVWQTVYLAVAATLSNRSVTSFTTPGPGTAISQFILNSDGRAQYVQDGVTSDVSGEWRVAGASSDFEARATVNSGSLTAGTTGSWVGLSSTQTWSLTRSTAGLSNCNFTLEIRRASDGVVLTSASITLTSEVDVGS